MGSCKFVAGQAELRSDRLFVIRWELSVAPSPHDAHFLSDPLLVSLKTAGKRGGCLSQDQACFPQRD